MVEWRNRRRLPDNNDDPDAVRRLGAPTVARPHQFSPRGCTGYLGRAGWASLLPVPAGTSPRRGSFPTRSQPLPLPTMAENLLALRLLAQAGSQSPHLPLGEDRDRRAGCRCERKQRRGGFLTRGQRALKDHGLIDDAAAAKMADRHDQTRPPVAIAMIELARIRPSAAVLPLGMCPEPAPIKPDNFIQRARHRDGALPQGCGRPFSPATNSDPENVQL
jgi:hypothetical protein